MLSLSLKNYKQIEFTHQNPPIMSITFRTEAEIVPSKVKLEVNDTIVLIGSCFVEGVGQRLEEGLLPVMCNPYGTVYNPLAISKQIERIIHRQSCSDDELISESGRWHSKYAHSRLSANTQDEVKANISQATEQAARALANAKCLVITFGTAWIYRLIATGEVVANCHKLPANQFQRELLSVDDIVRQYDEIIKTIQQHNNSIRILFTVSPIRHLKETLHGNQISKATLLLAIDKLMTQHTCVEYFPSYEILLDDLRDYRFYADDMVHPSNVAVDYIYDLFAQNYLSSTTISFVNEAKKISQSLKHRNLGDEVAYQRFIATVYERALAIKKKYNIADDNHVFAMAVHKLEHHLNI